MNTEESQRPTAVKLLSVNRLHGLRKNCSKGLQGLIFQVLIQGNKVHAHIDVCRNTAFYDLKVTVFRLSYLFVSN